MKYIKKYGAIIVIVFVFFMFIKPLVCGLILGSLVLYIMIEAIIFLEKIKKKGVVSTGKIIDFESDSDGDKIAIVEYKVGNELITGTPFVPTLKDLSYIKKIDEDVSILHDPKYPEKFILTDYTSFNYFIYLIFIFAGLTFIFLSIFGLLGYIEIN